MFKVFGFVGRAQHIGVSGVGLFRRHLVAKSRLRHERRHFRAAAQFVNKGLIQPRLVNAQRRVGQKAVAVEALNVITLVGAAITPDVHIVFAHRRHQHGAGHRAANGGGVEVGHARSRDVEGPALQRGNTLCGELAAAVDQTRFFGAVFHGFARNVVVIGFVGLAQIGRVGIRHRALVAHPVQRGAGVKAAGKGDADFLANRNILEDGGHIKKAGAPGPVYS